MDREHAIPSVAPGWGCEGLIFFFYSDRLGFGPGATPRLILIIQPKKYWRERWLVRAPPSRYITMNPMHYGFGKCRILSCVNKPACDKATVVQFLISDAGQKDVWMEIFLFQPSKSLNLLFCSDIKKDTVMRFNLKTKAVWLGMIFFPHPPHSSTRPFFCAEALCSLAIWTVESHTLISSLRISQKRLHSWPKIKPFMTKGKALYFSHGFGIVYHQQTGIIPPKDIDVILVAPKGSGLPMLVCKTTNPAPSKFVVRFICRSKPPCNSLI